MSGVHMGGWLLEHVLGIGIQCKLHSMLVLHAFCNDWQPVSGATLLWVSGTLRASQFMVFSLPIG